MTDKLKNICKGLITGMWENKRPFAFAASGER